MAKRGRKPKQKANGVAPPAEPVEGHNNPPSELTDDQKAALFFQHKSAYEAALAVKKKAEADFKNACKRARAELGDDAVDSIKDAILLDSEEGEAKIKAAIERQQRVARWMAVPLFAQTDFFGQPDLTPAVDRAFAEGKREGQAGNPKKPPHDPSVPQYKAWMEGWEEGQRALFSIQRKDDGALFDAGKTPEPIGDQPSSETVTA